MSKRIRDWTLNDALTAISAVIASTVGQAGYDQNVNLAENHDHWMDGTAWMGPDGGPDAVAAAKARILANVFRQFTPVDAVSDCLDNLANAVAQRLPRVCFELRDAGTPDASATAGVSSAGSDATEGAGGDPPDSADAGDAADSPPPDPDAVAMEELFTEWATPRHVLTKLRQAIRRAAYSTRGGLRVWVPSVHLVVPDGLPGAQSSSDVGADVRGDAAGAGLDEQGRFGNVTTTDEGGSDEAPAGELPTGLTFADALSKIEIAAPPADVFFAYVDPETHERALVFHHTRDDQEAVELWTVNADTGMTEGRILTMTGVVEQVELDLGGRLPGAEMVRELLITEPVRRMQHRLNFFESVLVRNGETAGFRERYIINAKPQAIPTLIPPSQPTEQFIAPDGTTYYLAPVPRVLGASITNDLYGVTTGKDAAGNDVVATPTVTFADPVDPRLAIAAAEHARRTILRQCKQGHLEIEGDATASAVSRQQARASFVADVLVTQAEVERAMREVVEAVLALASRMSREYPSFLDRYRVTVEAHVDFGPLTSADLQAIARVSKDGGLSLETALAMAGVKDVEGELGRIRQQPEVQLQIKQQRATLMQTLVQSGLGLLAAAEIAGFGPDDIKTVEKDGEAFAAAPQAQQVPPMTGTPATPAVGDAAANPQGGPPARAA